MNDDEMQAYLTRLESEVADLGLAVRELREELADALAGGNVRTKPPTFAEVEAFVADELAIHYARHVGTAWRWCPRWSEHPEAYLRVEALCVGWREAVRLGRVLPFLRDLDAQMAVLSDPSGPFAACTPHEHRPADPLPTVDHYRTRMDRDD